MKIIISPAKTQNFSTSNKIKHCTIPDHLNKSEILIKELKKLSKSELMELMSLSDKLADLNLKRFKKWNKNYKDVEQGSAILSFAGTVYESMNPLDFSQKDLEFAQKSLRILSGLYGFLKPLDRIMPYRLEMKTSLNFKSYNNLYDFWKKYLTENLITEMFASKSDLLINLASKEYSKSIDLKKIPGKTVTPVFKEKKDGKLKTIGIFAKEARGMMTKFIIKNRINNLEALKKFNLGNYNFHLEDDKKGELIFIR